MKIGVIGAKGLPPKQGGIEHYCAEIYPRMVAQGHSVDLYARSSYTGLPPFAKDAFEGVKVVSLPCPGLRGADAFVTSALGAVGASTAQYDVLHFHALGPSLFTWIPKIASSAKIVVTCHGLDWQRNKWGKKSSDLIQLGERAAVHFADEIIVVSKELQSYFMRTYGRETVYIPNAPATYANSDPDFNYVKALGLSPQKYILFLGRLVPEKCPDLLVHAFQSLQHQGWKLVLVGGDSDAVPFASDLREQTASNLNILFTGELSGARLAEVVRGAGLFVLPSNLEGMPLALLEAMQEGIPAVVSDIPPHRELLGSERGILFKVGSAEDLSDRLAWVINHPEEMAIMAKKAKNYLEANHRWEQLSQKMLHVFERLSTQQPVFVHNKINKKSYTAGKRTK